MAFFSWSRWLRSLLNPRTRPIQKGRTSLRLEQLETRLAPATFIWTGKGANNNWNNPANWSTNQAPVGDGTEDLVFGQVGATVLSAKNNILFSNHAPTFNSITISSPGYTLYGGDLTLGAPTLQPQGGTGQLNVGAAAAGEIINLNISLGGAGSGQQIFSVGAAADLTINGTLSNPNSSQPGWTKQGVGRMTLTGNNSFTEPFTVAQGIVNLAPTSTTNTTLGNASLSTTTVQQNAQIQLTNTATVGNHLVLNGFGAANAGALLNNAGNNTWSGKIELDSNSYLGAAANTVLDITGQITDNAAGFAINKVGAGQIIFDHVGGNTYRGVTTVDNGLLTITDPNALGNSPTFTGRTIVNTGVGTVGTLQLDNRDPTRTGFVVANELLTLNGFGFFGGALDNLEGDNTWSGNVTLGSPPPTTVSGTNISVESVGVGPAAKPTNLLISGVIGDRTTGAPYFLDKDGPGRLILTAANRYTGSTNVDAGYLNVEDSQALGPIQGGTIIGASWAAVGGGTVTITTSAPFGFTPGQSVTITGMQPFGYNGVVTIASVLNPTQFTFALPNNPGPATTFGTATWSASNGTTVSSGAALELQLQGDDLSFEGLFNPQAGSKFENLIPNPKPDSITGTTNAMTFAESLTLIGTGAVDASGALHSISGVNNWTQGVFIPGSASIGVEADPHQAVTSAYFVNDYSLSVFGDPTVGTDIEGGNLIVGRSAPGFGDAGNLILPTPNTYGGWTDIKTGFVTAQDNQSLGQQNGTLPITLQPYTTIENGAALMLKPRLPGTFISLPNNFNVSGNGVHHNYALINASANAGTSGGTGGAIENLDGANILTGIIQFNGTAGIGVEQAFPLSAVDIIPSQLTTMGPLWDSTPTLAPSAAPFVSTPGGFNKLGSQRWVIVGPGTFSGTNDIQNGAVLLQNNTGLGTVPPVVSQVQTTTTVEQGATLELGNSVNSAFHEPNGTSPLQADANGGLAGGLAIYGEALVLKGKGDGAVGAVAITNGGAGYTSVPTVTFSPPQVAGGVTATGIATILNGQVQSVTITNHPSGYTSAPTVTFTGGGFTTIATAVASNPLGDLGPITVLTHASAVTGPFNDPIFPTDNLWAGPVILAADSNFDAQANGRLVVTGIISDSLPINGASESGTTVTVTVPTTVTNNYFVVGQTVVISGLSPAAYNGTFVITSTSTNQFTYTAVPGLIAATVTSASIASSAASLNLVDLGEVDLYGSNTYQGTTDVKSGVLSLGNSQALGTIGSASVQTVSLTGATVGSTQFILQFGSVTTSTITYVGNTATDVQAVHDALMNLPNVNNGLNVPNQPPPSDLGGQVSVAEPTPGNFTITFGGSMLGFVQPKLRAQIVGGPGAIAVNVAGTDTYGGGGTIVESGASLQIADSITIPGEPLQVNGAGVSATPNIPTQWFPVGPAPINDGQTAGAGNVTGRVTGVVANPLDPNIIYISTAGGGAWKTIDGGKSWHQIFDAIPAIQTITVPITVSSFSLTYAGMDQFGNTFTNTTVPVTFNVANPDATAAALQAALNDSGTMPNLTGAPSSGNLPDGSNNGGFVTVTQQSGAGFTTFQITFQGALSGQSVPTFTASDPSISVSVAEIGGNPGFAMFTGAITIDPNNPNVLYLGTGEANNYSDSFYGTGIYQSNDAGVTWTLILDNVTVPGTPINPFVGKGVNKIAIDSATGDIFVADGDGGIGRNEVQQMSINAAPGQKITITLTAPDATQTLVTDTVVFTYTGTPVDTGNLTALLTGMTNIGGIGGTVSVAFTPAQTISANKTTLPFFTIKFGGTMAQKTVPLLVTTPGFSPTAPSVSVAELVRGGPTQVANGSSGYAGMDFQGVPGPVGAAHLAGIWRFDVFTATWFLMTDYITGFRASLVGKQAIIPNTPGPDDEFRITFPYYKNPITGSFVNHANWTDVSILHLGIANDGGEFGPAGIPTTVVYGSLGTAGGTPFIPTAPTFGASALPGPGGGPTGPTGSQNPYNSLQVNGDPANGLYRCENPLSTAPAWLIGDPGQPKDQVETITIQNPAGSGGVFNLIFPGKSGTTNDPGPTNGNWTPNLPYKDPPGGFDQSGTIAGALDGLPEIGGRGGAVIVALASQNSTTSVYTVTFVGTLSFSPQPIIGWHATTGLTLNIQITTPGGGADTESNNEFPTIAQNQPGAPFGFQHMGNIKLEVWQPPFPSPLINGVVYASVMDLNGNTLNVYKTTDGGHDWAAVTLPGNYGNGMGNLTNTIALNHNLANPNELIVGGSVSDIRSMDNQLFLTTTGGTSWVPVSLELGSGPHTGQHASFFDTNGDIDVGNDGGIWRLVDPTGNSGVTTAWSDLNGDLAISQMNSVASFPTSVTGFFGGATGNGTVEENANAQNWVVADDSYGGLSTPFPGATTQVYGGLMSGGQVYIDPTNPKNIYAEQTQTGFDGYAPHFLDSIGAANPGPGPFPNLAGNPIIRFSTDGGASWNTLWQSAGPITKAGNLANGTTPDIPFVMDPLNPNRLLVGGFDGFTATDSFFGTGIWESLQQGAPGTWVNLENSPNWPGAVMDTITGIAVAEFQGPFTADANFPDVTDQGSNTYDPNTIYATDGTNVVMTKDHAVNWVNITSGTILNGVGGIYKLVVDPTNRDVVYALRNVNGVGEIFKYQPATSTTAADWVEVGANFGLPPIPVWSLVVDPRNNNMYAGTDNGVYELLGGLTSSSIWEPMGVGMPNVQVKDLVLNQTTNTLLAATHGRGVFELFLSAQETSAVPVVAAVTALSGISEWDGPVLLGSNTVVIGAAGNPAVQNPLSTAQINFVGQISDVPVNDHPPTTPPSLVKDGLGFVVLSGPNVYGGTTDIQNGAVIVNNIQALGLTNAGTTVEPGAALQLESSVDAEPLTLMGDGPGIGFNGHNTGALESIANDNTYFGTITLAPYTIPQQVGPPLTIKNVTIGVASHSTLTIVGKIQDNGQGMSLTKELPGTLIFDEPAANVVNSYSGTTFVYQGALAIESSSALNAFSNTVVLDGAEVQLVTPGQFYPNSNGLADPNFGQTVTGSGTLSLSGTGINNFGALLDGTIGPDGKVRAGGNNIWNGNIILDANAGFASITLPIGTVTFGTGDPADILTITGAISDKTAANGTSSGLGVVGKGTVVLTQGDTYQGTTYVNKGSTLRIQNSLALGGMGAANAPGGSQVQDAILRLTIVDPSFDPIAGVANGAFTLSLNGGPPSALLSSIIPAMGGVGPTASLQNAVAAQFGVAPANISVSLAKVLAPLAGSTAPSKTLTEFVYTIVFQGVLSGTKIGQLLATAIQGAIANISTVADGGVGALVRDGGTLALDLATGSNTVSGVALQLNGTGVNDNGALENVSGDNVWEGPATQNLTPHIPAVTLNNTNSGTTVQHDAIGVDEGTSLTILPDADGTPPIAGLTTAALDKVGRGTLILPTANSYQGTTFVQNGILQISHNNALGTPPSTEIETITLNGSINGTYRLSLDGVNFTTPISVDFTNPATLTQLQNALNVLLGAGNTIVSQVQSPAPSNVYTITFAGALAGMQQNIFTVDKTNAPGTGVVPAEVIQGGRGGTTVEYNAATGEAGTLQLANSVTFNSGEVLTLNGPGFTPTGGIALGALDSEPTGNTGLGNTWENVIVLASNSSIGVGFDPNATTPGLTVDNTVIETPTGSKQQLTKVGQGSLMFTGATNNSYTGVTTVANGTLLLNKPPANIAIAGDLTVGVPGSTNTTLAKLLQPAQLTTTATVTVNTTHGTFDVNNQSTSIRTLVTVDGTAQTGNSGVLTLAGLNMTGGFLHTNVGGQVLLNGPAQGTSDTTTGAGIIDGTGIFSVNGGPGTFNITRGPGASDMDIQMPITAGAGSQGITKSGNGILELDADNTGTMTVPSTVTGGELQVDGKVGDVHLAVTNSGGVSGKGIIGNVTGNANTLNGLPQGAIAPGDNGSANAAGTLTTKPTGGSETWGGATTLLLTLNNPNNVPNPVAGADYDQLVVDGSLFIGGTGSGGKNGGAILGGLVGANVNVGQQFTIVRSINGGIITGRFSEPFGEDGSGNGIAFINGVKFLVIYSTNTVVLQRVLESTALSLTSSLKNNTSVYGQPITFTANMLAEAGAGSLPTTDQIKFTLTQGATTLDTQFVHLDANGNAVYNPQLAKTYGFGTYTLQASFVPDSNFTTPPPASLTWTVNPDPTTLTMKVNTTTPVFGQVVVVTVTAVPTAPGDQTTGAHNPSSPTPNVTFTVGGQPQTPLASMDASGSTTFTFTASALGNIIISASYAGDGDYLGSNNSGTPTVVTVGKDNTSITLVPNPTSPALVGQTVTFTARLGTNAPGTATPKVGDTIQFTDKLPNGTVVSLGSGQVTFQFDPILGANAYEAQVTSSTLVIGTHQITASFSGDTLLNGTTSSIPYIVNTIPTAVTLTEDKNPSILNQQVVFTATITPTGATGPGSGAISGPVNFFDSSVLPNKLLGSANVNSSGQAILAYPFTGATPLGVGTHTIYAVYAPTASSNYTGSTSNTVSETVFYGDTTSVTSSLNPATFGQSVTFTATVTPVPGTPGIAGTPAGTVDFLDGTTVLKANVLLDAIGMATFTPATPLSIGTHTIVVKYNNSTNQYITSQGQLTENIRSATSTVLSTSVNPTGLGLPLTLTATVSAVSPGTGVPLGTVTFFDAGVQIGTGSVDSVTGLATFTTSSLALGTHPLTASYGGTPTGYTPSSSNTVNETVIFADTTTLVSSLNPSPVTQAVTFTATVKANSNTTPGFNPTGTVNFFDNGTQLNGSPVVLLPNGTATFTTAGLSAAIHAITAVYSGNTNFISTTSAPVSQVVLNTATTSLFTSKSPTVYSEPFTLTVVVTPNLGGLPTPTGTVAIFDGNTQIGSGTLNGTGQFSFTPAPLTVGTHNNLTAVYSPSVPYTSSSYYTSTSLPTTEVVTLASSTTTITSSSGLVGGTPTSVYSEPVTFTAQVLPVGPAQAIPTGVVTFFDDTGSGPLQIGTANLDPVTGLAAFTPTTPLLVGTHSISATYAGTPTTFQGSSTTSPVTQHVTADNTTTTLATLSNTVYGQPVTFAATVKPVFPGTAAPSGTVNFFDDTGSGPAFIGSGTLNSSGVATFTPSSPLTVGAHSINAAYVATTNFNGSTSAAQSMQVSAANTSTQLALLTTQSVYGQAVTFQATVTVVSPGTGIPSGTVIFLDDIGDGNGPQQIGSTGLNGSGVATFMTVNPLPVGSQKITASYVATTNYAGSTSPQQIQVVTPTGTAISVVSSSALSGGVYTAVYSQLLTFTATVTATGLGGGTPTGTVYFYDGNNQIGTGTLNGSGQATFSPTTPLTVGSHLISAAYGSTTNFQSSTSATITQQITQEKTSVVVNSSANPSVYTQPVTFTAVVTPTAPGTSIPIGTMVTFKDGTNITPIGTAQVQFNSVAGDYEASFMISTLAVSALGHQITATFPSSTNYIGSTSPIVKQIVTTAPTATTLSSSTAFNGSQYTVVWGQKIIFTAVVSALPGTGIPLGTVNFFDGMTRIGSGQVNSQTGVATFVTATLSINTHSILATYAPTSLTNFKPSNSGAITQVVTKADSNVAVAAPTNPSNFGQATAFTITVTAASPGGGIPGGTVTLIDQDTGQTIGTAALTSGKAVITAPATGPTSLQFGSNSMLVLYSGNTFFNGGTGGVVQNSLYSTTTTLSVSPTVSFEGDSVTLTATVVQGVPITKATESGSKVTITSSVPVASTVGVGKQIVISGMANAGYNGTFTVASVSGNTFTYNNTVTGLAADTAGGGSASQAPAGSPAPTGVNVNFFDGANLIGTGGLVDGTAQLTTNSLSIGTHLITAVFPGDDSLYAQSKSPAVTAKVFAAPAALVVKSFTKPTTIASAFSITAVLVDINNVAIAGAPGMATVTAFGTSPDGGFAGASVTYNSGKFSFTNLHVTKPGRYQLLVSYGNLAPVEIDFTTTGRLSG
jgi:autotransporter-associated beta strand protein